jgi:hypothetical protein
MSRRTRTVALVLALFGGSAPAQEGGLIDRVQMGDNDLDCAQIADQVHTLDALLDQHSGDQGALRGAAEAETRSRTGDVVAGVAKILPFGSVFGDIAKDVIGRRGREADARVASARARKEYLVDMFLKRGCKVADLPNAKPVTPAAASKTASKSEGVVPEQAVSTTKSTPTAPAPVQQSAPATAAGTVDVTAPAPSSALPERIALPPSARQPGPPLFVLDFRLAFRTRADVDGAGAAPDVELTGVRLTAMQAITDAAYLALVEDLKRAGYEVLNPDGAVASTDERGLPAPARGGDYLYFAPSGAPLAQAPGADEPGSVAALDQTRAALAGAVNGRRPGVRFVVAVWYVDFARVEPAASHAGALPRLETHLSIAAGSHLALVEPAAQGDTGPDMVQVVAQGRDLASRDPYGQMRLSGGTQLEYDASQARYTALAERQLKRSRSLLIAALPAHSTPTSPPPSPAPTSDPAPEPTPVPDSAR